MLNKVSYEKLIKLSKVQIKDQLKRRFIIALFIIVLGGSCFLFFLNKRIEGVWILNYTTDNNNDVFIFDGQGLWNIENQKIYYHHLGSNENVQGSSYFDFGINFKFEPEENDNDMYFKIDKVKGDSLVFRINGLVEREIVLKKIADTLKNNSDWEKKLVGKAFEVRIPNYVYFQEIANFPKSTDTIYFDSQFIMHKNQIIPNRNWISPSWNLAKIEGFDIMYAKNWTTFILKENTDGIVFYGYDTNGRMFKCMLNEIQIDLTDFKKRIKAN